MSAGERGPTGDHGQAGDQGQTGIRGERGEAGAEGRVGESGERGQAGDSGQAGVQGERGRTGAQGPTGRTPYTPILVRHAAMAYSLLVVGVILSLLMSARSVQVERERDAKVMARFEQEVVATDRAFCAFFNYITSSGLNPNREAIRNLQAAVRSSFDLVRSGDGTPSEQRQRTDEFRMKLLALIDRVEVNGNLPPLDCSGIGNGAIDFSLQDAITQATTSTVP